MKHARADYDRIQDPAGLIPRDEPVMLLRAQDLCAWKTVRDYADRIEKAGAAPAIVKAARDQAQAMRKWPKKKVPDLAADEGDGDADSNPDA